MPCTLFGTQIPTHRPLIVLQRPPQLLTLTVWIKVFSEFELTSVGLALYGWLFRDTNFIGLLKLKANKSPKRPIVQALKNPTKILLLNPNHGFSSNIYEYPNIININTGHNRLKNHRYIFITQSFSYYQLKNRLKHYPNIMELPLFQNILL